MSSRKPLRWVASAGLLVFLCLGVMVCAVVAGVGAFFVFSSPTVSLAPNIPLNPTISPAGSAQPPTGKGSAPLHPQVGLPAPDVSLPNLDDDFITLSDLRGRVVIINFWAVWCDPCTEEMPLFQEYIDRYASELILLAVAEGETRQSVIRFASIHDLSLFFLLDSDYRVGDQYRVAAYPTSFFVDDEGILQDLYIGSLSAGELDYYLVQIGIEQ